MIAVKYSYRPECVNYFYCRNLTVAYSCVSLLLSEIGIRNFYHISVVDFPDLQYLSDTYDFDDIPDWVDEFSPSSSVLAFIIRQIADYRHKYHSLPEEKLVSLIVS